MIAAAILLCVPIAIDGDTLKDCHGQRWRLARIDAPELCRGRGRCDRRGEVALAALTRLIAGREVRCVVIDAHPGEPGFQAEDRYGRPVVRCQAGGLDLGNSMIVGGWARRWPAPDARQ